jgi:hypothetical protein
MGELTHDDLRAATADIKAYVRDRFDGIDGRLDRLNGSVSRHERELGENSQSIRNLEKEVFDRQPRSAVPEDQQPVVSRGDIKKVVGAITLMGAAAEVFHQLGSWLWSVLPVLMRAGAK